MKIAAIVLLGLATTSCAFVEDGVKQCESRIRDRLDAPSFYKRLPDEIGNLNSLHPDRETGYDQRWIDINYETRENGGEPVAHRYACVFKLDGNRVGALVSAGDRDPRLINYGKPAAPAT